MYYVVIQEFIKENVTHEMLMPHIEYIHKLIDSGHMVVSGPFSDKRRGGMFILDVGNDDKARELVENDPAVKSGILKSDLRPYNLSFLRKG